MGILKWLAGKDSILGNIGKSIGLGDFVESAEKEDLLGVASLGLTRGIGRQIDPIVKNITGEAQKEAIAEASEAQVSAAEMGIQEQQRQFDAVKELLSPYVSAGTTALNAEIDLMGLGDPEGQERIINEIIQSPQYTSLVDQGEEALIQNAAARGGRFGGNLRESLQEFRPNLITNLINQKLSGFRGLRSGGQSAATGTGSAGQFMAGNVGNLYGDIGSYQAGDILSRQAVDAQVIKNLMSTIGTVGGFAFGGPAGAYAGREIGRGF